MQLSEGVYQESVTLAAVDVDIVGEGDRNNITIESVSKPVISFRAMKGAVRNITLRQTGGGCECAVDISAGALALEGCDISGESDSVILVHGSGTRPNISNNMIHDGTGVGLTISDLATPTVVANEICGHQLDGIVISTAAHREIFVSLVSLAWVLPPFPYSLTVSLRLPKVVSSSWVHVT